MCLFVVVFSIEVNTSLFVLLSSEVNAEMRRSLFMKHFKQFTSFALAVVLAAGFTAAGAESEAGESSAASANTVKLGLMIAKNGQSLSSDEWEVLADIFEDVINNKHEDLSLPFASDEGLPGGGLRVRGQAALRHPVPSGGAAHARRNKDDLQLRQEYLRMCWRLAHGLVR